MPVQEFFEPVTLDEASSLAMESKLPTRFLGGGTDLMIQLKATKTPPLRLISLKRIHEIRQIEGYSSGEIFVGALVSHSALSVHPEIERHFPALAKACSLVGSPSIRNMGTVGGNICNSSPAADTAPPLLAYDASLVVRQNGSDRRIKITDFFQGPGENILRKGDILKGFLLTKMDGYCSSYEKLGYRRAMEIGIVNVCVAMKREGSLCRDIRVGLGSVAPTPIRALGAEEILKGKKIEDGLLKMATEKAMEEITPITDLRASADYRRAMTQVLMEKTVRSILDTSF
ncbi:MAG: xanthine dehydrogenase family protein subunit M [Deltaproteobacteria bacterium]|nr:xanthine dehydrogenase family protein subunit M [Deltaproteobacteria bacterium]MBW2136076.1 xanthine dehydrogenase family protein subunit M [Deltaproteobacteria bacterium]